MKKQKNFISLTTFIVYVFVMLVLFSAQDFAADIISHGASYEIRYEATENSGNGQKIYRLYKNGEYRDDVDPNEFELLDENGSTDYWYCSFVQSTRKLIHSLIFTVMLIIITQIVLSVKSGTTPFTEINTRRIKAIAYLQLAQAVLPGLVTFIMKTAKFSYIKINFTMDILNNIVLFGVILFIAQVFDYGVKLQQDNDLIA